MEMIMEDDSDFRKVSRSLAFVDKSMLIKTIFRTGRRMLITAPDKFGKSTNLHMIKCFLSDQSERSDSFIFDKLKIYENGSKFFLENFRKHPVVFVNFASRKSASYEHVLESYRRSIHRAFLEHEYLMTKPTLKDSEREMCRSWCDMNTGFKQKQGQDVANDLSSLIRILKRDRQKDVVVLIDDYDSVINNAIYQAVGDEEFNKIVDLTSAVLRDLMKDNMDISLAVLTGVSCTTTADLSCLDSFEMFPFLDQHPFVNFFGLTGDEVDTLFMKREFQELSNETELVKEFYGGYLSKQGTRIYNIYSILKFLKTKQICCHWKVTDKVVSLTMMASRPEMARTIHHILKRLVIKVIISNIVQLKEVYELKNAYSSNVTEPINTKLVLHHLIELGLLTYDASITYVDTISEEQPVELKIPNLEVHRNISNQFQRYIIKHCGLSPSYFLKENYNEFVENMNNCAGLEWSDLFHETFH